jgi:hypothetical protein
MYTYNSSPNMYQYPNVLCITYKKDLINLLIPAAVLTVHVDAGGRGIFWPKKL